MHAPCKIMFAKSPKRTLAHAVIPFVALFAIWAPTANAQRGITVLINPAYQRWQFSEAVPLDSIKVSSASQIAAPFLIQLPMGAKWTASASAAAFTSSIETEGTSASTTRTLSGVTDLRLRATGKLMGDAFRLTVGVNIPTGAVGLSPEENDVLRVVAAPALGAQVAVPGTGFGGTIGVVSAKTFGTWAWAAGASYEQRGNYSPLEAQLAGVSARTEFEPGASVHLSLGGDGLLGAHRLTVGVLGDLYGSDAVRSVVNSGPSSTETYQLGPSLLATATLLVNNPSIRDLTLHVRNRYRSSFKDDAGTTVDGSSGNYLDASASGLIGRPGRAALLLGVDVRQHGGLPVDKNFIGAGLTEFGVTVGASFPTASVEWRPMVRASTGTLRTGLIETSMTGISAGLSISNR